MKPAFSYYGGKQRQAHNLLPLIPKHTVYVEPFAGGASLLFAKPLPDVKNSDHYREVINDTNGAVVNFYRVLKAKPSELIAAIDASLYSRAEYERCKVDEGDDVERARRWFVNINQSFANKRSGGWGKSTLTRNHPMSFAAKQGRLQECADRIKHCYVEQQDAVKLIEQWDSPQTFFYCDPPYVDSHQGHYAGYMQDDLNLLIATLDRCAGSFLVSGYENAAYPKQWKRWDFTASSSATVSGSELKGKARTEVVVGRAATVEPSAQLERVMAGAAFDCFRAQADVYQR